MKKFKLISIISLVMNIVTACSAPPSSNDISIVKNIFDEYKTYTKINNTLKVSPTHGGKFVFTYINNMGIDSFRNKTYPYPNNTVSVKEAHGTNDSNSPVDTLFVMKKISGFDKDNGDWYYSITDSKGNPMQAGGKIQMCISCHQGAKDKDYIFGFEK